MQSPRYRKFIVAIFWKSSGRKIRKYKNREVWNIIKEIFNKTIAHTRNINPIGVSKMQTEAITYTYQDH